MIKNMASIQYTLEEAQESAINDLKNLNVSDKVSEDLIVTAIADKLDTEYLARLLTHEVFKVLLLAGYTVEDGKGNYITEEDQ